MFFTWISSLLYEIPFSCVQDHDAAASKFTERSATQRCEARYFERFRGHCSGNGAAFRQVLGTGSRHIAIRNEHSLQQPADLSAERRSGWVPRVLQQWPPTRHHQRVCWCVPTAIWGFPSVKSFSKSNYYFFGYFAPINAFFNNKSKYFRSDLSDVSVKTQHCFSSLLRNRWMYLQCVMNVHEFLSCLPDIWAKSTSPVESSRAFLIIKLNVCLDAYIL